MSRTTAAAPPQRDDASLAAVEGGGGDGTPRRRKRLSRWQVRTLGRSFFAKALLVNGAVLVAGTLLLIWTPVTVSSSITARQVIVLVVGLAVLFAANAALLRFSFRGLAPLVRQMRELDLLRPQERLLESGSAETRMLINGFNDMRERLEAERRASTRRSVTYVESERRRISRELHDEVGQRLVSVLLQLSLARDEAAPSVRARIAQAQDETRAVMDEVGALAWNLRPAILDDLGLLDALKTLSTTLGVDPRVRMDVTVLHELPPLTVETELAVYRIAQEALTNAVRHSGARNITLGLEATAGELVLRVTDDGHGLPGRGHEGAGLRGMRERALSIGARLDICNGPSAGLRVTLAVPTGQRT